VVIADKQTKIAEGFKFTAIPVTVIFNRGKVVLFNNGPMDFDSAEMNDKMKNGLKSKFKITFAELRRECI